MPRELRGRRGVGRTATIALAIGALAAVAVPAFPAGAAKAKTPTPIEALHSFAFTFSLGVVGSGSGSLNSLTLATEGVYVAPSSQDCTATGALGALKVQRQAVVIGKKVWVDSGDGLRRAKASDFDFDSQCPSDPEFWDEFDLGSTGSLAGEPETKNGIPTEHIDLSDAAGELSQLGILEDLPSDVTFQTLEAWRATKGGWIAALDIRFTASSSDTCDDILGDSVPVSITAPCTISVKYDISQPNDKSLAVKTPKSSGRSK